MESAIYLLLFWLPELYFTHVDGVQALAWAVPALGMTAIILSDVFGHKKSTRRGNDWR